jgi:hypothetical protein
MSIRDEPHYELPAAELAAWIEQQGADQWWTVDGDWVLPGRMAFPCPGDELAAELRRINRPLLIADNDKNPAAQGQPITRAKLDALACRFGRPTPAGARRPPWADDGVFLLRWKDRQEEWLLVDDEFATEGYQRDLLEQEKKG